MAGLFYVSGICSGVTWDYLDYLESILASFDSFASIWAPSGIPS